MLRESILLKELSFDDISNFKSQLLILRKRVLSDQLHDLVQLHFLMEHFFYFLTEVGKLFIVVLIEISIQLTLIV